jgi:hypothetical protein
MFLGSKVRWVLRADNLTASMSRLSRHCGILNISQPYRPSRPVTGIAFLFYFLCNKSNLMELSPSWEVTNCAATQEFPSILWNLIVHYRVQKSFHWSLSWARSIQPIPYHPIPSHPILSLRDPNRSSGNVSQLKYLGTTVKNQKFDSRGN